MAGPTQEDRQMLKTILAVLFMAILAGCANVRGPIADWIGPTEVARAEAAVADAKAKLEVIGKDAEASARLRLEIEVAKARLTLADAKAKLLEGLDRIEAEAANALARKALEDLQANLTR